MKDLLVDAIDAYRAATGRETLGSTIDNWGGGRRPEAYEKRKPGKEPASRAPIAEAATERAAAAGAKRVAAAPGNPFAATADQLGRASHALEDFFAHSNWLELARELRRGGATGGQLRTGTFELPDKCHALGHKLVSLADALLGDFATLGKVYERSQGRARTTAIGHYEDALGDLRADRRTPAGELVDILGASHDVAAAVQRGKVDLGDFLVDKELLMAIRRKGETMMLEGEKESPATGHGKLAKDAPDPHRGDAHELAHRLATEANRRIIAPLREVMSSAEGTGAKERLLAQLALVDEILQPPSGDHPLIGIVK